MAKIPVLGKLTHMCLLFLPCLMYLQNLVDVRYALNYRYWTKLNNSIKDCQRMGICFLPLVDECLGGWHKVAVQEVKKLAAAMARHTGEDEGEVVRRRFVCLSILIMKGNAAML